MPSRDTPRAAWYHAPPVLAGYCIHAGHKITPGHGYLERPAQEERDYNPPRRERILEWQAKQDFPIIPDPSDPSAGNVYRDVEMPDEVYEHIEAYHEQRVGEHA